MKRCRRIATIVAALLPVMVGCKAINEGRELKSTTAAPKPDPIYGMRLPPQDVPITGKTETAAEIGDPLYRFPKTADAKPSTDRAGPAKPAKTVTSDVSAIPPRKPGPYSPTAADTPAALAGGLKNDLRIERRPNPDSARKPAVIPVAAAIRPTGFGESFDDYAARLKAMNAKWSDPIRRGEGYAVLVDVPIGKTAPGPLRRYEGQGATPTAALKSALDQVTSDRK